MLGVYIYIYILNTCTKYCGVWILRFNVTCMREFGMQAQVILWYFSQIYVEIERARLTRMLAQIKEDQGDITGKEAGALICYF